MFKVVIIGPKLKNAGDNSRDAKHYAVMPTAIVITQRKELRKVKFEHASFFKEVYENSKDYTVIDRGSDWHFEDKYYATKHLLAEARSCGHHIPSRYGWVVIENYKI